MMNDDRVNAGIDKDLRESVRFAMDADITVYWPWVRACWEEKGNGTGSDGETVLG